MGDTDYVWFDDVTVVLNGLQLMCVVQGKQVPLPVMILHESCTLQGRGDTGRLGVPRWWAEQQGLRIDPLARG